jgi:hypothetical protein
MQRASTLQRSACNSSHGGRRAPGQLVCGAHWVAGWRRPHVCPARSCRNCCQWRDGQRAGPPPPVGRVLCSITEGRRQQRERHVRHEYASWRHRLDIHLSHAPVSMRCAGKRRQPVAPLRLTNKPSLTMPPPSATKHNTLTSFSSYCRVLSGPHCHGTEKETYNIGLFFSSVTET